MEAAMEVAMEAAMEVAMEAMEETPEVAMVDPQTVEQVVQLMANALEELVGSQKIIALLLNPLLKVVAVEATLEVVTHNLQTVEQVVQLMVNVLEEPVGPQKTIVPLEAMEAVVEAAMGAPLLACVKVNGVIVVMVLIIVTVKELLAILVSQVEPLLESLLVVCVQLLFWLRLWLWLFTAETLLQLKVFNVPS